MTLLALLPQQREAALFVGTACGDRSQWLRNLRAEPRVSYWLAGYEHRGAALVFAEGTPRPATQMLPALARGVDPLAVASVATLTSCTSILWP